MRVKNIRHEVVNHYHTPFKTRKWDYLLFVVRFKSNFTCLEVNFSKTEDTSSEQLNIFTEIFSYSTDLQYLRQKLKIP